MANISHLRTVFLNKLLKRLEYCINGDCYSSNPHEDIYEHRVFEAKFALEDFYKQLKTAKAKNQHRKNCAEHKVTKIGTLTNTRNCNRLSSKRRKAKKHETTVQ